MVVHAEPIPRLRKANMKLHTAGRSEPHPPAPVATSTLSSRPQMQGIINIGALEIREGHFRGIIRKAGALLKRAGTRPTDTQEYKVITVAQPLHP